jgi:lipopolysaccharide export system protein LptC
MKPRASSLFPLVLAIALAGVTFWLERTVQMSAPSARDAARSDPDAIAHEVQTIILDEQGRLQSTLSAIKMVHFPHDDSTELVEPKLVQLREKNEPPIRIRADRGTVSKDGEEVRFYGNVVLIRDATAARPELRAETVFLQVFPNQRIARTPERVVIVEGRSRLAGTGMVADARTDRMTLESAVTGTLDRGGIRDNRGEAAQ